MEPLGISKSTPVSYTHLDVYKRQIKTPLNDPQTTEMVRNQDAPFGSEQLIKIYLQALLITIIRNLQLGQYSAPAIKSMKLKSDDLLYNKITTYLEEHIREHLTICLLYTSRCV